MSQPQWGTKHTCPECASKYYDLGKKVLVCPSCGVKLPAPKAKKAAIAGKRIRASFGHDPLRYRSAVSSETTGSG